MELAINIDHFVNQQLAISHRAPWPKISGSLSLLWAEWVSPIGTVANNQRSAERHPERSSLMIVLPSAICDILVPYRT
jgi:hypothetical protein